MQIKVGIQRKNCLISLAALLTNASTFEFEMANVHLHVAYVQVCRWKIWLQCFGPQLETLWQCFAPIPTDSEDSEGTNPCHARYQPLPC